MVWPRCSWQNNGTVRSVTSNLFSMPKRQNSRISPRPNTCRPHDSSMRMGVVNNPADRAGAILEIDLAGIAANWLLLARRVEPAGCAAVVKADAYGLGASQVSAALATAGCRLFFTATLDEAIALRRVLADPIEIAVLNGAPPGCAGEFVQHRLVPVLNEP